MIHTWRISGGSSPSPAGYHERSGDLISAAGSPAPASWTCALRHRVPPPDPRSRPETNTVKPKISDNSFYERHPLIRGHNSVSYTRSILAGKQDGHSIEQWHNRLH